MNKNDELVLKISYPPIWWIGYLCFYVMVLPPAFTLLSLFFDKISGESNAIGFLPSCLLILFILIILPAFWNSVAPVPVEIRVGKDSTYVIVKVFFWTKQYEYKHDDCILYEKRRQEQPYKIILQSINSYYKWTFLGKRCGWDKKSILLITKALEKDSRIIVKPYSHWKKVDQ